MRKLSNVPEILLVLSKQDWQWGSSFEAHDWLEAHVAVNSVLWVTEALTKASTQVYGRSWSVALAENRDPQALRDLAKLAHSQFKEKVSAFTISGSKPPSTAKLPGRRVVA